MRSHLIPITVLAVSLLLAFPLVASAQSADPASVVRSYIAAVNAHDLDAATALLADDIVERITPAPPGTTGVTNGKQQYRAFEQTQFALQIHVDVINPQVAGQTVTFTGLLSNDAFRKLGIDPAEFRFEFVVQGGLIQSASAAATPRTLAKLQSVGRTAQVPARMPGTGGGGDASPATWVSLILSAALLMLLLTVLRITPLWSVSHRIRRVRSK